MDRLQNFIDGLVQARGVVPGGLICSIGATPATTITTTAGTALVGALSTDTDLNAAVYGMNRCTKPVDCPAVTNQVADSAIDFTTLTKPLPDDVKGTRGEKAFIWALTTGAIKVTKGVDGNGQPTPPEAGPNIFRGALINQDTTTDSTGTAVHHDYQSGGLRQTPSPSVLLAEIYYEQATPAVRNALGAITAAATLTKTTGAPDATGDPQLDNHIRRHVLLTAKYKN